MKIIEDFNDIFSKYDTSLYITKPVITKYEKTKILGLRMEQLARGAPTLIDPEKDKCTSIQEIAVRELEQRKIPFMIVRTIPNGQKEYWRLEDMVLTS
jgi:DNA-directed RNA polymerase subunit K/omega